MWCSLETKENLYFSIPGENCLFHPAVGTVDIRVLFFCSACTFDIGIFDLLSCCLLQDEEEKELKKGE